MPGLVRAERGAFPVAEHPPERRPDRERRTLHRGGREGKPDGVEMRVGDHGEPERVGQPSPVRLALGGEREHRLDQRLERERGPHLAEEAGVALARVPEPVRGSGRNDGDVARLGEELLRADTEADQAVEHLEALGLVRVDVRGRDEAVRPDDRLHQHRLAAGLLRRPVEDQYLAGDGVLERVSWADHGSPLVRDRDEREVACRSLRCRRPRAGSCFLPREDLRRPPPERRLRTAPSRPASGPGRPAGRRRVCRRRFRPAAG